VAVVNQSFVRDFFKEGSNPIGRHFGSPGTTSPGDYEIVAVVEDTAYTSVYWKNHSMYFVPMMQRPVSFRQSIEDDTSLYAGAIVLQTERPTNAMEKLAQTTLADINPNLTVVKFQTFDQRIADRFNEERMIARSTMRSAHWRCYSRRLDSTVSPRIPSCGGLRKLVSGWHSAGNVAAWSRW
jgi:macrolide transport system ATP-binding/permease protein